MTAVTVGNTYEGWNGDIKEVVLTLTNTPTGGYTYDTKMDATDGAGAMFREIFSVDFYRLSGNVAADTKPSWDSSTGIITLGTITTPISTGTLVIRGR